MSGLSIHLYYILILIADFNSIFSIYFFDMFWDNRIFIRMFFEQKRSILFKALFTLQNWSVGAKLQQIGDILGGARKGCKCPKI